MGQARLRDRPHFEAGMNRHLKNLDQEIRDHIERETLANIDRGMSPADARAAALRAFGNITRVTEKTRDVWSLVWLEQLWQDIRYGVRMLVRNPGFTAVVVLTLGLGIGMNTAVFSVVNAVLLRPVGYPNPDRLVWLGDYDTFLKRDIVRTSDFVEWREHAKSFNAMSAYSRQQASLVTVRGATNVTGVAVASDFWAITGARPALGRLFGPEEHDKIVLAWDLFEHDFSGDPRLIGQTVMVEGRAATLTGVLPKDFRLQFPRWWITSDLQLVEAYLPLVTSDRLRGVQVVGALKPGVGTQQALAELEVMEKADPRPAGPDPRSRESSRGGSPGTDRGQGTAGIARALRGRHLRSDDRRREHHEPAAGASHRAAQGNSDSSFGRSGTGPRNPAVPDREPDHGDGRRRIRPGLGARSDRPTDPDLAERSPEAGGNIDRRPGAGLHHRRIHWRGPGFRRWSGDCAMAEQSV
jgi:hypothetical protein